MGIFDTKLPFTLAKITLVFSLIGILIGLALSWWNQRSIGEALVISAGMGLVFALCAKYFILKWMLALMETKLETAKKEREEARRTEAKNRMERREAAKKEAERIKAEEEARLAKEKAASLPK